MPQKTPGITSDQKHHRYWTLGILATTFLVVISFLVWLSRLTPKEGQQIQAEQPQVRDQAQEHAANLRTCLSGLDAALCNHQQLNTAEAAKVQAAEAAADLRKTAVDDCELDADSDVVSISYRCKIAENLTRNMTRKGVRLQAYRQLIQLHRRDYINGVQSVKVTFWSDELSDIYGNTGLKGDVLQLEWDGETLRLINWDGVMFEQLFQLARSKAFDVYGEELLQR